MELRITSSRTMLLTAWYMYAYIVHCVEYDVHSMYVHCQKSFKFNGKTRPLMSVLGASCCANKSVYMCIYMVYMCMHMCVCMSHVHVHMLLTVRVLPWSTCTQWWSVFENVNAHSVVLSSLCRSSQEVEYICRVLKNLIEFSGYDPPTLRYMYTCTRTCTSTCVCAV